MVMPVLASRASTRPASFTRISRRARLRMTVVTVCEPALPPVPMRSGMKKEIRAHEYYEKPCEARRRAELRKQSAIRKAKSGITRPPRTKP